MEGTGRVRIGQTSVGPRTLVVFLGLSYLTLAVAGVFTRIDAWYDALVKPSWTPPGWFIGTVWWILYTLIGISAATAWSATPSGPRHRVLGALVGVNLVLNATWSLLFFTLHQVGAAAVHIAVLWVSTLALTLAAWRASGWAGAMLLPYLAWVAFAGFLNVTIWRLNT